MKFSKLTSLLTKPDQNLFFHSKDSKDKRLGDLVSFQTEDYDSAEIVIISCGQDQGVSRNHGRPGAAEAPEAIRSCLYKLTAPQQLKDHKILDLGDTSFDASLEEIHQQHYQVIQQLLADGKRVIVLGGGNDISYPDVKALQSVFPGSLTVNVDNHLDIRSNLVRNSGTPYRQLLEESIITGPGFYELGYQPQANAEEYLKDAETFAINLVPFDKLRKGDIEGNLRNIFSAETSSKMFLGFDMDSVKSSDAPGVSATTPTGFTSEQACDLVTTLASSFNVMLFEITEVNPQYDVDDRTAKLAAVLIHRFLTSCKF